MKIKINQSGLLMFFKEWQIHVLNYLWKMSSSFLSCKDISSHVNNKYPISRSSIYFLLENELLNEVLESREVSGKGGKYKKYKIKYTESELTKYFISKTISKMLDEWEEETTKVIQNIQL